METNETMVENEDLDTEADGTLPESVEEDSDESEEESLDSLNEGEETLPADGQPEQKEASEPGWIKGRIDKAVRKAVEQVNAQWQEKFEATMAPIIAKQMEDEAQELVRSRKVADIELAREIVRFRNGQPAKTEAPAEQQPQPRDANGQFAPRKDPVISARIEILSHQADRIKEKTGLDVMAEFDRNAEIKKAILSGEMDFYEVAEQMKKPQPKKRPPSPMRSPNGASGSTTNVMNNMTDEQFERMEKRIREGARYSLK